MKKDKCLFLLVFITSLSLILASFSSMEQVERVRADDYSTYIHPGPSSSHIASGLSQIIAGLPILIFHFVFSAAYAGAGSIAEIPLTQYSLSNVPIFLFCRQIII